MLVPGAGLECERIYAAYDDAWRKYGVRRPSGAWRRDSIQSSTSSSRQRLAAPKI